MVRKKAQITIFITLSLLILFVFALIFYLSTANKTNVDITDTSNFKFYMDRCIKQYAEYSLYKLGYAGGDLTFTNKFERQYTETSYALHQDKNLILPLNLVEKQLEQDLISGISQCAEQFPNQKEYNVDSGETEVDVLIADRDVVVTVKTDITLKTGNTVHEYDKFMSKIKVPVSQAFDAMHHIVNLYKDKKMIELHSYLAQLDFETRVLSYKEGQLLFYLIDKKNLLGGKPFFMRFGVFS